MAQLGNWFSRVFSNDGTRGLSGDADFVAGDHGRGGFYASRLRLHSTPDDLVEQPMLLWETGVRGRRRSGLLHHIAAERGDGLAGYTDLLLVINQADWDRSVEESGDYWKQEAQEVLEEQLLRWCKKQAFNAIFPDRPFQIGVVRDGSEALRGHHIGLEPGQFVSGLVPNCYAGPLATSAPVLTVHLNIPGAWEGYRKVGLLHSDQLCFTLGNHWLDNFHHEALEAPALYQLQQYPDGSLVHVINPEHQRRYEVGSVQSAEGPSVLAITERGGGPVAFLVLGVVDTFMKDRLTDPPAPTPDLKADGGSGDAAAAVRRKQKPVIKERRDPARRAAPEQQAPARDRAVRKGRPIESTPPTEPTPAASVQLAGQSASDGPLPRGGESSVALRTGSAGWHHTIVPDAIEERIFTLRERGALLQRVHFSVFMEGYDVFVSRSGQLGTSLPDPEAIFQVREDKVYFMAIGSSVRLAGRALPPQQPVRLRSDIEIRLGRQLLEYRDMSGVAAEGWPYLGEIRRTASSTYMVFGGSYRVGRDRRCKVRLPDEPHNDNIVWRLDMGEGDFIRSRTGDIPKSRFYNDSIMVASLHAEIDLRGEPKLRNLARHCYSYVRRDRDVFALFPGRDGAGLREVDLLPGDQVLVGNSLFEVSYPPERTPEVEKLTAESLARAAQSLPDDSFIEEGPAPAAGEAPASAAAEPWPAARPEPPTQPEPPPRPSPQPPPRPARGPANDRGPLVVEDAPVAGGLGELGPAPAGVAFSDPGFDSILGIDAPLPRGLADAGQKASRIPPAAPAERSRPSSPRPAVQPAVDDVVVVDERGWQQALSRPARLQLLGWMITGEVLVGNHRAADVIIPENRTSLAQRFRPRDYFRLASRGRRGRAQRLDRQDARLLVGGEAVSRTTSLEGVALEVLRRDEEGTEDFVVALGLAREPWLPDPRASLLAVDEQDRMVTALFALGVPLRARFPLRLGNIDCVALFDGRRLTISDYLDAYSFPDGSFQPFFRRCGGGRFQTAPEDGAPFELAEGDMIIAGSAVYVLQLG